MLGNAEHIAVVALDQLLKRAHITVTRRIYQRQFFGLWLRNLGFNTFHMKYDSFVANLLQDHMQGEKAPKLSLTS